MLRMIKDFGLLFASGVLFYLINWDENIYRSFIYFVLAVLAIRGVGK